ncbi:hypothetical protein GGI15_001394 [Coemansia interrupta]|uniref:Zn(2)-C6 fungal-type domain-containing protein n=1 Tax=Coemansia interrupta TaxID=1126814 RepID=A0A9W8LLF9_9FUNG|nr:hypothetical protein GGI15_001394 [Coemansia interrupta]
MAAAPHGQQGWRPIAERRQPPAAGWPPDDTPGSGNNDDDNGRSSSDAAAGGGSGSRAKRAQVKNACVNCQRACKKCDSGRPCQRCVKYSLQDTCVDSKRKPRKKGVKRGPYKKRKKNDHDGGGSGGGGAGSGGPPPMAVVAAAAAGSVAGERPALRRRRTQGARTPRILGPGAIPILLSDPGLDESDIGDSDADDSGSDTPLVQGHVAPHPRLPLPLPPHHAPAMAAAGPETPTAGLAAAFSSLATTAAGAMPGAPAARFAPPQRYAGPGGQQPGGYRAHAPAPLPFAHSTGAIRLPPIASFDQAHPRPRPAPPASSLAILTDVALSSHTPPATQPLPPVYPPYPMHPPHDPRSPQRPPPDDSEQLSLQPPDDARSRHTTTGESDLSTNYASSADNDEAHDRDAAMESNIQRLSRRLRDTHLDQDSGSDVN